MVDYSRLTSKVWRIVVDTENGRNGSEESTSYLDYQVQQWSNLLPTDLRLMDPWESDSTSLGETRLMLKVLLYLRGSQLRIILRKPDLLSRERISKNKAAVEVVVDLARDMVHRICALHQTTRIYEKHRTAFDSFLVSAVAVFCLVTCYAPDAFYSRVQGDFLSALKVVRGFLTTSISARRLWKTVRQIQRISPHLDSISETSSRVGKPDSTPSVTVESTNCRSEKEKHLSRPALSDPMARTSSGTQLNAIDVWPEDPFQVSQELDDLFEAFNQQRVTHTSDEDTVLGAGSESGQPSPGHDLATFSSQEDSTEVFRLFTELF